MPESCPDFVTFSRNVRETHKKWYEYTAVLNVSFLRYVKI